MFELKSQFHSKFGGNLKEISILKSGNSDFDLDMPGQKFHHSLKQLKEHHKIRNIPKFRCEMLQNADNIAFRSLPFFSHFALQSNILHQFDHLIINFPGVCNIPND